MAARIRRLISGALLVAAAGCSGGSDDAEGVDASVDDARTGVVLLAAKEPGEDPFGPSFGESLELLIDRPVPGDAIGRALSVEPVIGSEPELYGRVDLQPPCDLDEIIELYGIRPDLTELAAEVLDVSASALPSFLRSYVAVVLTRDTFVIDHRLVDSAALPTPTVLQAGTTVLIDPLGQPQLRCASLNPLTEPAAEDLDGIDDVDPVGEPWTGFDPARLVVVQPAAEHLQSIDFAALG